mmetsp:Transcript_6251/g.19591  ORF Transcript_6251/g.19591 Transcript_6251/m.19591 type:complete len:217 (-) Transcript_6251:1076-1726(-)
MVQLAGQHPGLVRLPPALVGPPGPRLVLRPPRRHRRGRRRRAQRSRGTTTTPFSRTRPFVFCRVTPGRGRAGHVVFVGPVAVRDGGVARRGLGGLRAVLSGELPRDRLRHFVLLGGAHGHARHRVHRQAALRHDLHARPRARRKRPENEQDQRQRRRSSGSRRSVRRRRPALHSRHRRHARPGRPAVDGKGRAEPQLRQQALERRPLRRIPLQGPH